MTQNCTALVTGGNRGLGRGMVEHLTAAGVDVVATYRTGSGDADDVASATKDNPGKVIFLQLDVTHVDGFPAFTTGVAQALAEHFGRTTLDALVNNAGIGVFAPYETTTVEQFDAVLDTNLRGPYFLTQHLLPLLRDGATVLNVSTALTRGVVPTGSAYAASKGALEVLTRYQAAELAGRGIRVNTLMGGAVTTDFADGIMLSEEVRQSAAGQIAFGRIGAVDDMTAAVPSLISDAFRWSTGGIFDVSGGQDI